MDNISHSLVGLALAESVYQRSAASRSSSSKIRALYWFASIASNNLPDADLLLSFLLPPFKLGYLLHHRGHTHTLLLAPFLGLALAWAIVLWNKRRGVALDRFDFWAILGLAVAGPWVHLGMDALGSYGVHPFWPFSNRWVYGDSVFILEPLIWLALLPVLFFGTQNRRVRWGCEVLFFGLLAAAWAVPLMTWFSALTVTLAAVLFTFGESRLALRWRADAALALSALIILFFAGLSQHVRGRLVAENAEFNPSAVLYDVVLSPLPANPFCWSVMTIETFSEGTRYRVRRGVYAPFARFVEATQCPTRQLRTTASLREVASIWGPEYFWEGQYQASVSDFKIFRNYSCAWNAYLRFSRAPFLSEEAGDFLAGDLRFDFEPGASFAEVLLPQDADFCNRYTPPWDPPRADIFFN
ncbi:metal-dependent hydrolase [bacterium]|nr:metal-dependent hydrolase [bacterium]